MQAFEKTSILVIGGGPGGATAAAFLARSGFDVTVVERAQFPRYHIGESLLPSCLEILDLIGARDLIEKHGFQYKSGAVLDWKGEKWELAFGELQGRHTYAFQVERAKFDHLLLEHARQSGAKVIEGVDVRALEFDGDRPRAATLSGSSETGKIEFDHLIDASGRRGLMATEYLKSRTYHDEFKNIAVWGYWKGTNRLPDNRDGSIAVGSIPGGWIWGIPLSGDTMSVGVVLHRDVYSKEMEAGLSLEQIYDESLRKSDFINDLLEPGTRTSDLKVEQDYSYSSKRYSGDGYLLVGDAACFLDPLLSTGVHLAMYSAMLAAASLTSVIRGTFTEAEAFDYYQKSYQSAYMRFFVFVQAFYRMKGKDNYYEKAADLSSFETDSDHLKQAFLNLVSGLEDVAVAERFQEHLVGEMQSRIGRNLEMRGDKDRMAEHLRNGQARENAEFFDTIEGLACLSPAQSIGGIYVETRSGVQLARVPMSPEHGAQISDRARDKLPSPAE